VRKIFFILRKAEEGDESPYYEDLIPFYLCRTFTLSVDTPLKSSLIF
jgi:hypothetical protein